MCEGGKVVDTVDYIMLFIERGVDHGFEYVFDDAADEHPDFRAGDVKFKIE